MIRVFCSTNECITQARQLEAARLRLAAAEAQATRLAAERDAMAGELAAARAAKEFYINLYRETMEAHR